MEKDLDRSKCFRNLRNKLDEDPDITFPDLDDLCPPSE